MINKKLSISNGIKISSQRGQIMIVAVIFFICISTLVILAMANPLVRHISMATSIALSKQSFYTAEAGMEDVIYRLNKTLPVAQSNDLNMGSYSAATVVTDEVGGKALEATGQAADYSRKVATHLALGTGISFHYGIQAGAGGFFLYNSSTVNGNVHSSGPVVAESENDIDGDVVSAGPAGIIDGAHVYGSAFAHTIQNAIVNDDAYYSDISGSLVFGASYAGSPDQPTADLPISDVQITEWEIQAAAEDIIPASACTGGVYSITSDDTLGPVKIECDLLIKGSGIKVTIGGPVWVTGNITFQTSPTIQMDPELGSANAAIIADNPADRINSSIITVGQGTDFQPSGFPNSFVFLISQNNSAENGGAVDAFSLSQSSASMVAYASHGQITLAQSVSVKEATAYKIILRNSANVTYDTGLVSSLFSAGPSGGFNILSWREIE